MLSVVLSNNDNNDNNNKKCSSKSDLWRNKKEGKKSEEGTKRGQTRVKGLRVV